MLTPMQEFVNRKEELSMQWEKLQERKNQLNEIYESSTNLQDKINTLQELQKLSIERDNINVKLEQIVSDMQHHLNNLPL